MTTTQQFTKQVDSPIGRLLLVADGQSLSNLLFANDDPARVLDAEIAEGAVAEGRTADGEVAGDEVTEGKNGSAGANEPAVLTEAANQLADYFAGKLRKFELDLKPVGTEFQLSAWRALDDVAYGETRSYQEQAAAIGKPKAVRAIGAANGKNPLPIIRGCHRIVGSNGSLTGYGGGIEVKQFLIDLERSVVEADR